LYRLSFSGTSTIFSCFGMLVTVADTAASISGGGGEVGTVVAITRLETERGEEEGEEEELVAAVV
jgi:hypothetical protein